ncbi:MAG: adenine phosphoribosyltransferase [Candidatus Caenarcaniphilales bacterium]|nr:adenine phosphoribosyltransferase [Candidatus Caenarcaniphilales bacterium]
MPDNIVKDPIENKILNILRDVPDFPKPGIMFKDITPILSSPKLFSETIDALTNLVQKYQPNCIAGIEARGFLFGTPIASKLQLPFIPIRKPGKLPWKKKSVSYSLEYGEATIEVHEDALDFVEGKPKVAVIDDLLATGGTTEASCKLIKQINGEVVVAAYVLELGFLTGRQIIEEHAAVESLATVS